MANGHFQIFVFFTIQYVTQDLTAVDDFTINAYYMKNGF